MKNNNDRILFKKLKNELAKKKNLCYSLDRTDRKQMCIVEEETENTRCCCK